MRDEAVIYVASQSLLNRRCTRIPGCFHVPKCNFLNNLTDVNLLTKLKLLKAVSLVRYSLIVLNVLLNPSQSVFKMLSLHRAKLLQNVFPWCVFLCIVSNRACCVPRCWSDCFTSSINVDLLRLLSLKSSKSWFGSRVTRCSLPSE